MGNTLSGQFPRGKLLPPVRVRAWLRARFRIRVGVVFLEGNCPRIRENIYKMMSAWLMSCRSIHSFVKKQINNTKRETERKILREQLSSF